MELSREVYSLIVRHVATRADLLSLCLVSKRYRQEAQRALFNTLHLRGYPRIFDVCRLLSATPRLSRLVDALSLFLADERPSSSASGSDDESEGDSDDGCTPAGPPHGFWPAVAAALRGLDRLRFLSVYFEQAAGAAHAWVLAGTRFRLRTFHCEFDWDAHLVAFLRTQPDLTDLYLADYRKHLALDAPRARADAPAPPRALPALAVLECTFGDAAAALVPGRPVARVKTCFSRSGEDAKRGELRELLARLRGSRRALCALDLADEAYTEDFSLELLAAMGAAVARFAELRYLGTLVLPVDGRKRLQFYGRLMKFPKLRCVELEVSDWEPPPMTPAALRALTYELRIYCPSITQVVFVYEFDRAVMSVVEGNCVLDPDAVTETLWRDV